MSTDVINVDDEEIHVVAAAGFERPTPMPRQKRRRVVVPDSARAAVAAALPPTTAPAPIPRPPPPGMPHFRAAVIRDMGAGGGKEVQDGATIPSLSFSSSKSYTVASGDVPDARPGACAAAPPKDAAGMDPGAASSAGSASRTPVGPGPVRYDNSESSVSLRKRMSVINGP